MQYGLSDEVLAKINRVFSGHPEVVEVVIYGSRAKGNFKPGSDIDLTLKGECLELKLLNKVSLELDDLLLPYTFDLSLYEHLSNQDFLDHIKRVGRVFYKNGLGNQEATRGLPKIKV